MLGEGEGRQERRGAATDADALWETGRVGRRAEGWVLHVQRLGGRLGGDAVEVEGVEVVREYVGEEGNALGLDGG